MMSAQAQIEGYQRGYPEFLYVSYEFLNFTYDVSAFVSIQEIQIFRDIKINFSKRFSLIFSSLKVMFVQPS